MSKTIIINNTYAGNYGADKDNLPHEVINFFKADQDGEFYVYITPYGTLNNKIKKDDIQGILFVRSVGNGLVEVLAKAEVGKTGEFYTQGITLYGENKTDPSKSHSIQSIEFEETLSKEAKLEKIKNKKNELQLLNEKIKYGGTSLKKIHEPNQKDNEILVSLKVEKICLPKKTFYLSYKSTNATESNDDIYLIKEDGEKNGKKINNQKMIAYYYENDKETAGSYERLLNIINDDEKLWKNSSETPAYNPQDISETFNIYDNFFKVTRQQDNEVMFSNMFYYYFSEYPELRQKFIEQVLNNRISDDKKIELSSSACVEREKERMDVRITDDKNYIIIENKIKSCINGTIKKKDSDDFEKENGGFVSQLSDYYKKAIEKNKLDSKERKIYAFIFAPNYSVIDDEYKKKFFYGEKYTIIHYSEIYDFFKNIKNNLSEEPKYLSDFTKALKKHTEKTDDEFRKILMLRLKNRIEQNKNLV